MTKPIRQPRRGRPRTFDEGEVLTKVMTVFWEKGYDATSLDDLSEATGLTRPSLYGAFGNKAALYERAAHHKEEAFADDMRKALYSSEDLSKCVKQFFRVVHRYYTKQEGALGCPIITTPLSSVVANAPLRHSLEVSLAQLDDLVLQRLLDDTSYKGRKGRAREDAKIIVALLHSMAIRTRTAAKSFNLNQTLRILDRLTEER